MMKVWSSDDKNQHLNALMELLVSKFRFLEFRLLLSRVAPYYSSLPRTVWLRIKTRYMIKIKIFFDKNTVFMKLND